MTRTEHVEWCKQRARQYLDKGDIMEDVTSMMSDMDKHPECRVSPILAQLGMMEIMNRNLEGARRFVEGFN